MKKTATTPAGPKADKELEAVIKRWKDSYPMLKQFDAICKDAKAKVETAIQASGSTFIVSKLGIFELGTSEYLDKDAFKSAVVALLEAHGVDNAQAKVDAIETLSKRTSSPFVKALPGWAAESKASKVAA